MFFARPIPIHDEEDEIKRTVKLFNEEGEIDSRDFDDIYDADDFFMEYPLDDMVTRKELWGYDAFGDWELLDEREVDPE